MKKGLNILSGTSKGKCYFVRFTEDPHADVDHKYSRWYDESGLSSEEAEAQNWLEDGFGFYKNHSGLSGHYIAEANCLQDVLDLIADNYEPMCGWFRNIESDNYAIFEGVLTIQDTPEGHTFKADRLVAYVLNDVNSFNNWRDDYSECLTDNSHSKINAGVKLAA